MDLTPRHGELVALRVADRLTVERMRYGRQIDIANALARSVSEDEVRAGRIVLGTCSQLTDGWTE